MAYNITLGSICQAPVLTFRLISHKKWRPHGRQVLLHDLRLLENNAVAPVANDNVSENSGHGFAF